MKFLRFSEVCFDVWQVIWFHKRFSWLNTRCTHQNSKLGEISWCELTSQWKTDYSLIEMKGRQIFSIINYILALCELHIVKTHTCTSNETTNTIETAESNSIIKYSE